MYHPRKPPHLADLARWIRFATWDFSMPMSGYERVWVAEERASARRCLRAYGLDNAGRPLAAPKETAK